MGIRRVAGTLLVVMGCGPTPSRAPAPSEVAVRIAAAGGTLRPTDAEVPATPERTPDRQLSAGGAHTCAVKRDGSLWCWGRLYSSSHAVDPVLDRFGRPARVEQLGADVAEVSAGQNHTCARKRDGTLWCWGGNYQGELGQGARDDRLHAPEQVTALGDRVVEIAAGWDRTCARDRDRRVWCWGDAPDGNKPEAPPPTVIDALGEATGGLAAGQGFVCARRGDGTLWCEDDDFLFLRPRANGGVRQVEALGTATARIAAGRHYACASGLDGALWCWGSEERVVGAVRKASAKILPSGSGVVDVAAGDDHACALMQDGTLWCWGSNDHGQLGDGTTTSRATPAPVAALKETVVEVAAGSHHTCVRTSQGSVWCWGWAVHSALGSTHFGEPDVSTPGLVSGEWP
jgi:alpha-tubulin suppressor-like RCC1 family protein